ncbi:MAG: formate dehydrogenase accessory sulfurtransferase FdhD [Deltaproteobacteria bacterium]|nr:formate dehydrogenase accessory sulfurtransferase FdhD [Deltaproteobacteria bacterium]
MQKTKLKGLTEVKAHRIATDDKGKSPVLETCGVAVEEPLTIDVMGVDSYTVLCTPDDKRAMAVGFLFSEGIIGSITDIALLNECKDDPNVLRVQLADGISGENLAGRNLLIVSSCGICGSESMEEKLSAMPKVGNTFKIKSTVLRKVSAAMRGRQVVFKECGGTHAIGLFDATGQIISFAEDIGRHNALDKAIGKCILSGKNPEDLGAAMSGRVSLEMVGKCARAGIELISAVSAPTSLALKAADNCDITVLAFVRDTRATIFTRPKRVIY